MTKDIDNNTAEVVKNGIYRHFKGNEYQVIDIGLDCETLQEVVIYRALYGDNKIWVRAKDDFCGFVFRDNKTFKRFELIK